MIQKFPFLIFSVAMLAVIGVVFFAATTEEPAQPVACTEEAKLCPDGSAVGRTGPQCEFSACPLSVTKGESTTTARLLQTIQVGGIFITPLKVLEDSRCPVDVQCIQAGRVMVAVKLESGGGVEEASLTIGSPITFVGKRVELLNVLPIKNSKQTIKPADYRFEFNVKLGTPTGDGVFMGQMTIGPICPVERVDNPCKPTPEMYAARKVFIYKSDKKTLVVTLIPDAEGGFSKTLPVGTYYVDMVHQPLGIGGTNGVPAIIKIESGKTAELAINIDTGIR
jgi:hypothetical protein